MSIPFPVSFLMFYSTVGLFKTVMQLYRKGSRSSLTTLLVTQLKLVGFIFWLMDSIS